MSQIHELTLAQAGALLKNGELSPIEYLHACLTRIEQYDPYLHSFISIDRAGALASAQQAEQELRQGQWKGPLHGIPVSIKDLIDIQGQCTSAHSALQQEHRATHDATIIRQLKQAGAIIIGKTALHEFATGGPTFDLPWPPARNPWNNRHHPGGSSSGAGASVAAGFTPLAIGTDTGGSVRHPATACSIYGLKPTYDLWPRTGVFPLAFSLDHLGILARTAEDTQLAFNALTCSKVDNFPNPKIENSTPLHGLKIGVIDNFNTGATAEIQAAFEKACTVFTQLGAHLQRILLPPLADFVECGRLILQAEAFAVHKNRLQTRAQDYASRTRTRILPGAFLSSSDYLFLQQRRRQLMQSFTQAMSQVDVALCISSLEPPCAIDDLNEINRTYDLQARTPFNLTGSPALAAPMGFASNGLPIGLQIVGKNFSERQLLAVAQAYGQASPWETMHPQLSSLKHPN